MSDTIVVVEDNPDDEALVRMALRRNRIENPVVCVRDGVEAVALLAGPRADAPALVLLDLKMPKLDGLDVLRAIRAPSSPSRLAPVVVLTSSIEPGDLRRAYGAGANSYLRKPVDFEDFVRLVGLVAAYWLERNEPPPDPQREEALP
ncbi:MAG TPA: response regulator [Candidatus Thermoplasmatota archaeon]|jgi:two-component system response regulator|nr:response regulator [Candidatus Thermoplasmatota archaeon]